MRTAEEPVKQQIRRKDRATFENKRLASNGLVGELEASPTIFRFSRSRVAKIRSLCSLLQPLLALMRIEFPADPQEYIVYPLTRPWFGFERLPAVAALRGDLGLLYIDIVKVKVAINSNHCATSLEWRTARPTR